MGLRNRKVIIFSVLFTLLICVVYYFMRPTPCIDDRDCVLDAFGSIAFGSEFEENIGVDVIGKVASPLHIYVISEDDDYFIPLVEDHARNIEKHTNLTVRVVNNDPDHSSVHMVILFSDDFDRDVYDRYNWTFRKMLEGSDAIIRSYERIKKVGATCSASFYGFEGDNLYDRMVVFIPSGLNEKLMTDCIQEEITQSIGLPNDNNDLIESSFNDRDNWDGLSDLDWLLLRILYHPSIRPGMSFDEVKQVFNKVYDEVRYIDDN